MAVLLVIDFDGTITDRDTLASIAEHWSPGIFAATEASLEAGEMTLNEVIAEQFRHVRAGTDEILAFLHDDLQVGVRPGLPELVDLCRERFVDLMVVSSGFHELIEPVLADVGLRLPVHANHAVFGPDGATVTFVDRPICPICGDTCKRADVARLRDRRTVAYVGDGWSDRCAAKTADLAFARDSLARHLDAEGVPYRPFDDFHDVRRELVAFLGP